MQFDKKITQIVCIELEFLKTFFGTLNNGNMISKFSNGFNNLVI